MVINSKSFEKGPGHTVWNHDDYPVSKLFSLRPDQIFDKLA